MRSKILAAFCGLFGLFLAIPASAQTLSLKDCMDTQYGVGTWTQRIGPGVGTDIGPALNGCLQTIRNSWGRGKIVIPPGLWLMNTPPTPALLSGNYVEGYGSQASLVVFNNKCLPWGNAAFWWSGAGGFTGGGMRGVGVFLESGLGDTNCYGIMLRGDATSQPDQTEFSDIYMSALGNSCVAGGSCWWTDLHIDGTARASPQGTRVVMLTNMQLFNARSYTGYVANGVVIILTNIGCWTGKASIPGLVPNTFFVDATSVEVSKRAIWCQGNWTP